ncbi:hypothetical protein AX17_006069 [Amanita inopinata Kibby_2008]|nr:hypothetical protein AX17_006069 [Amanita inopinata Kibby_2008]
MRRSQRSSTLAPNDDLEKQSTFSIKRSDSGIRVEKENELASSSIIPGDYGSLLDLVRLGSLSLDSPNIDSNKFDGQSQPRTSTNSNANVASVDSVSSLHNPENPDERNEHARGVEDLNTSKKEEKKYKSLMNQFNVQIALSTFACTLIVAFCAFVNAVISRHNGGRGHGIPFNVGVLLGFLAIAFHAGNIVISGRGAALCSGWHVVDKPERPVSYFLDTLAVCEHLYLHGTIFFILAVFEMSFIIFDHYVYPAIFCGMSLLGVLLLFTGKYREVSVVHKELVFIVRFLKRIF